MEDRNKDIFDRMMQLPVLRIFEPFYTRYKEVLLYLLFGGLSFILNIVLYILLNGKLGMNELIANVFCWIACVLFQFVTNRLWVFDGRTDTIPALIREMLAFFGGRVFTLLVEEAILAIFITWLGFNSLLIKLIAQIVVIVLNYIISKLMVFK